MDTIRWQFYPHVAENPHARNWLETQAMLGLANNTIRAYGRGANDYLAFCQRTGRPFLEATKADIVACSTITSFPHQQITIRPEIAKNGRGRVVMHGDVARDLLRAYLEERAEADIHGGPLFRSQSDRNCTQGITAETWDKIVTRMANIPGLHHRFTTHTLRRLRLTDLARSGMEIHAIAQYAGHRNLETTKIYLTLSGRETAEHVRACMQHLDRRLEHLRKEGQ